LSVFLNVVTIIFLILGLIGTFIPLIPGTLLLWLTMLLYAIIDGYETISPLSFVFISLIALITGTADYWMSLLGAKKGGAAGKSLLIGVAGAILGTFILPLLGTIIGYAAGVLFGEYQRLGNWDAAVKACVGGIAGWGIATIIQAIGGVIMLVIFAAQIFLP
jgi:uncharacterized protein YqgC (DUF456 family)